MSCVVDASVALKWYFREPHAEAATQVLLEGNEGRRELLAPDWIVAEVANVLGKKVRRRECSADQARMILGLFDADAPQLVEAAPLVPRALELALRLEESIYDCLDLAAAIESEASLVTADRRLARAARGVLAEVELLA